MGLAYRDTTVMTCLSDIMLLTSLVASTTALLFKSNLTVSVCPLAAAKFKAVLPNLQDDIKISVKIDLCQMPGYNINMNDDAIFV
jgi:hypothetical protein